MTNTKKPVAQSLREYARGIVGGLLFSLPMLYTMELWWAGFIASPLRLIVYIGVGLLLLIGYNHYGGIRSTHAWWEEVAVSIEEMGVGLLLTVFILWLTSRITSEMSLSEIVGKTVVEAITVAIGISIGRAQLGEEETSDEPRETQTPQLVSQLSITMYGAVLVAANIAPTEEVMVIALETTTHKIIIMALVSMLIGGGVLYYTNFRGASQWVIKPGKPLYMITGTFMMYAVALAVSAFMLWFFGRFEGISLRLMIAQTVVLSLPAALGASAGRLLIQP